MSRLLLILTLACSSPGVPEQVKAERVDAVRLDTLVGANVVSIMRTKPELFAPLGYVQPLLGPSKLACWTELEQKLTAAYQLQGPRTDGRRNTHWILEGDLPQAAIERCVPTAIKETTVTVKRDGDLLAISGSDGATTYAAWRGRFVIVGARDLVNEALTSPSAARARWHELLAPIVAAPIWWGSTDRLFANLFGVATTHFVVAFERLEFEPKLYFGGRALATYATVADATLVARRIKQGEAKPPFDAPEIVDSMKRFKVMQDGTSVQVEFDLDMFGGITMETLTSLIAEALR